MKIGINLLFLLPKIVGGTETYAVSLLEALGRADRENEYAIFVNKEAAQWHVPEQPNFHKVVCPIHAKSRLLRYAWEQLILPLQAKRCGIDVMHSLGYVQPLRLPCKSVVTIHDMNFRNLGHAMSPAKRVALRYFVSRSARRADHILTVSEFSKSQIVDVLGVPPKKVTVTYNAPKTRGSSVASLEELTTHCGVRPPYVMGLSGLSPHKNMSTLIRAFSDLRERGFPDLQLVLVGHRPPGDQSTAGWMGSCGDSSGIVFTGYVADPVLASLYTHAALFVFPSLYEGFGIPVLEAFSCGVPVVCSNAAALPEVAGDAALLFEPRDARALADVMARVLTDGDLAGDLRERGRRRVELFSWAITARKTLEIYDGLADRSS
jgi:glycosyltransferase involved in cell wall biosynthesis